MARMPWVRPASPMRMEMPRRRMRSRARNFPKIEMRMTADRKGIHQKPKSEMKGMNRSSEGDVHWLLMRRKRWRSKEYAWLNMVNEF